MSMKFESFRIDLEDENRGGIEKIISKVAREAYNKGIDESRDAVLGVDKRCDSWEEFQLAAESVMCANYVK